MKYKRGLLPNLLVYSLIVLADMCLHWAGMAVNVTRTLSLNRKEWESLLAKGHQSMPKKKKPALTQADSSLTIASESVLHGADKYVLSSQCNPTQFWNFSRN